MRTIVAVIVVLALAGCVTPSESSKRAATGPLQAVQEISRDAPASFWLERVTCEENHTPNGTKTVCSKELVRCTALSEPGDFTCKAKKIY